MKKLLIIGAIFAVGYYALGNNSSTAQNSKSQIANLEGRLVVGVNGVSVLIKNGKLWYNSSQKAVDDYVKANPNVGDFVRNVPNELLALIPVGGYLDVGAKLNTDTSRKF